MDNLKDDVFKELTDKVDDIFLKFQNKYGIKEGDIPFDQFIEFEDSMKALSEKISGLLNYQYCLKEG